MTALFCLAAAVYFEARGEPESGRYAVAGVVMARVASDRYPNTVCKVVRQNNQFSFVRRGRIPTPRDGKAWENAKRIARHALDDLGSSVPISGATHFHAVSVSPSWAAHLHYVGRIGNHLFYTEGTCLQCSRPKIRPPWTPGSSATRSPGSRPDTPASTTSSDASGPA